MKLLSVTTIVARRAAILVVAAVVFVSGLPQVGFAQSDPLTGSWKLNLEKSKFSPGPLPKSLTLNYQGEGQNRKNVVEGIDAEGKPMGGVFMHIYDGKPYPTTGSSIYDSSAYTRVDASTVNFTRTKAGNVVQSGTQVVSKDGKELTITTRGTGANGQQINNVAVFDKQ